jgi:lysophospholipase L1-like esterase
MIRCGFGFLGGVMPMGRVLGWGRGVSAAGGSASLAQPTVVVLGSSTAFGTGATNKDSSWAGRYTKALTARVPQWKVVNLGVGGYTTYHIQPTGARVPSGRPAPDTAKNITKGLSFRPRALIVNMPSNDANSGYTAAEQKANYDTLAALAARNNVLIWVCTPQPRTQLIGDASKKAALLEVKDWVLVRFGPKAVDFWSGIARDDASIDPLYNAGDNIHLNDRGHKLLFDRVMAEDVPGVSESVVSLARPDGRVRVQAMADFAGLLAPGFPFDARGRALPMPVR